MVMLTQNKERSPDSRSFKTSPSSSSSSSVLVWDSMFNLTITKQQFFLSFFFFLFSLVSLSSFLWLLCVLFSALPFSILTIKNSAIGISSFSKRRRLASFFLDVSSLKTLLVSFFFFLFLFLFLFLSLLSSLFSSLFSLYLYHKGQSTNRNKVRRWENLLFLL